MKSSGKKGQILHSLLPKTAISFFKRCFRRFRRDAAARSDGTRQKETGLLDLPLEVFQNITEHAVVSCGLYTSVKLRLVNKLFDREVMRTICTALDMDLDDYSRVAALNVPMATYLLFERAQVPRFGPRCVEEGLVPPILQTLEQLQAMCGETAQDRRLEFLRALCAAAANHLQLRQIFSRLGLRSLRNDHQANRENKIDLLSAAVCVNDIAVVTRLLRSGVPSNVGSDLFGHPLDIAAREGYKETEQHLLSAGAEPQLTMANLINDKLAR